MHNIRRTDNWIADLAFETALGYFSPDELQSQFSLDGATYDLVVAQAEFQKAVQGFRREIDESGKEFRLKARKHASLLIDELASIAADPLAAHSDRITAIREVCRMADLAPADNPTAQKFAITFQFSGAPPETARVVSEQ